MIPVKIREIQNRDAKQVAEMLQKEFGDDYKPFHFTESWLLEKIAYPNDLFLVVEKNNKKKGENIIGVIRACLVDIDLAELRNIVVHEEYRGNNIAERLIKQMLALLKKKGMRKVIVRTKAENKPALSLFRKLGFKKEGYFLEHFRRGVDIVQMYKFLE
ncbi:MAG: hypothetical protein DRO96_02355 [Candidatus Aenigmatarchaeota archaeon]|nr:MAG: hypothetical protein DRO96_02355 [Candidatus Aenigmarchaeota archaeon]